MLLLRYDESNADKGAIVCGTHREGVDDPSKLRNAPAYARVDLDEYPLAREPVLVWFIGRLPLAVHRLSLSQRASMIKVGFKREAKRTIMP